MERWTGASVWGMAWYHSYLFKLLGHLSPGIFRSLSLPRGQDIAQRKKGCEWVQAPMRGPCSVVLPSSQTPFHWDCPCGGWQETGWEPNLCSPGKVPFPLTVGLHLRERVGQVSRLGNLFWNCSHKSWVPLIGVSTAFEEVSFSFECEVMRDDIIPKRVCHTWFTGKTKSSHPFRPSCVWLLLEEILILWSTPKIWWKLGDESQAMFPWLAIAGAYMLSVFFSHIERHETCCLSDGVLDQLVCPRRCAKYQSFLGRGGGGSYHRELRGKSEGERVESSVVCLLLLGWERGTVVWREERTCLGACVEALLGKRGCHHHRDNYSYW